MKRLLLLTLSCLALLPAFSDAEKNAPSADQILARVRYAAILQNDKKLSGVVTKESNKIPFGIELKKGNTLFNFTEDGANWKTFELRFKEKGQELYTFENGKATKFTPKRYHETIKGTDITYEDLSLRFLYWPKGIIHPENRASKVQGEICHIIDVSNPSPGSGAYATVRIWIGQETGAMWQIHAFDDKGKIIKRFVILDVMKTDDGTWFFKRMRIDRPNPDNPKRSLGVNYIDLKK